tara:strand:+ start:913 stop:1491 length:579 start_codon:yes stop_codon:yes gene_type:complete
MNIFVIGDNADPSLSATMMCDKHIPKMVVESAQMLASALIRHGATPEEMPLTKKKTPYKGGYPHHPCTVWTGDTRANFNWLVSHGIALCREYSQRFGGKVHSCQDPIMHMKSMLTKIPDGDLTPFAQAMPDEFKSDDIVSSYRAFYIDDKASFAKWERGTPAPYWWTVKTDDPKVTRSSDREAMYKALGLQL